MMDLYHSHRLDSGKLSLVGLSNWLVRHSGRALSLLKGKQQPPPRSVPPPRFVISPRSVISTGPRFELLAILMVVLSRSLLCRTHPEAVPVVEVKEQQLSLEDMYRTRTD